MISGRGQKHNAGDAGGILTGVADDEKHGEWQAMKNLTGNRTKYLLLTRHSSLVTRHCIKV